MRMVVTATELDNFFWLRLHEHADPHINELAGVMLFALPRVFQPYNMVTTMFLSSVTVTGLLRLRLITV